MTQEERFLVQWHLKERSAQRTADELNEVVGASPWEPSRGYVVEKATPIPIGWSVVKYLKP